MKLKCLLGAASLPYALLVATPAIADGPGAESGAMVLNMKGITLNLGGFLEGDLIYRSRNLNSDLTSPFQSIPLGNTAGYYQDETRLTARRSRLSLLVKGDYSDTTHLAGYYEMDFLGAASTSNSNESNSYTPRLRHAYATVDWDLPGVHLLVGQAYSLVTINEIGIVPRRELIPLTIDNQDVPGHTWARQPQFRIVKEWDKKYWLGLSVENGQTTVKGGPNPPLTTNYANGQPAGNNFANNLSVNAYPDFVVKAAADPGWGHFEIYDLIRVFETGLNQNGRVKTTYRATNAVGGAVILPLIAEKLKVTLSGIYGEGIGRYGAAQLPDATQAQSGENVPLKGWHLLAGLIFDPTAEWTLYAYCGREKMEQRSWIDPVTGKGYGYGSELYDNSGAAVLGGTVNGNVQTVSQVTAGTWWKLYQGKMGKLQTGLQYSYTEDRYFKVVNGGAPRADDHMVFTSLRYYWQ
jgi:hypothetical protein